MEKALFWSVDLQKKEVTWVLDIFRQGSQLFRPDFGETSDQVAVKI